MKRSVIVAGLLGQECSRLRSAGFSNEDIIIGLKGALVSMEAANEPGGLNDLISGIEAMMDKAGFKKIDEGELGYDDPSVGCSCPVCTARRHRGAKHQNERNDV